MKDKTQQLIEMYHLVDDAEKILTDKNTSLDEFGKLLDYTWKLKRGISAGISTGSIDEQYDRICLYARMKLRNLRRPY